MRVGFVSALDADDIGTWSGTPWHMLRAIERTGVEVALVSPLREARGPEVVLGEIANRLRRRRVFHRERLPSVTRGYAREADARLAEAAADVVLSPSAIPVARSRSRLPIATWTDATFAGIVGFLDEYTDISRRTLRAGAALERLAVERVDAAIFASRWAADTAIDLCGADPERVHVVPFGANISAPTRDVVEDAIAARPQEPVELALIAADWDIKRGDFAVEVTERLIARGLDAQLSVVGPGPARHRGLPGCVRVLGFLDKAREDSLRDILLRSHLLLFPSSGDCFGIAQCEANACGVPVLATDTGGVGEIVRDGVNGLLLPPEASPDDHATAAYELLTARAEYRAMCGRARDEFRERLNWDVGAARVIEILESLRARSAR